LQQWSHASTIDAADRPNQVRYALRPGSKVPHRDGPDIVTDTPDAAQEKVSQMLQALKATDTLARADLRHRSDGH